MPMKQRLQNRRIIRPLLRLKNFLPFLLTSPCGILSFSYLQYRMLAGSEADGSEFPNDRTNATSLSYVVRHSLRCPAAAADNEWIVVVGRRSAMEFAHGVTTAQQRISGVNGHQISTMHLSGVSLRPSRHGASPWTLLHQGVAREMHL